MATPPYSEELLIRADRATVLASLARGLAHDLRGPLQTLTLLADPQADLIGGAEAGRIRSAVGAAVDYMTETIDRFCQVYAPRPESEPAPHILEDLVSEVADLQRYQRGLPAVELELRIARGLPPVRAMEAPVRHLLLGLILNAKQALGHREDGQLALAVEQEGPSLRILVDDSGPGIDPANRERVFEAFYTTWPGHLGIGLTVGRLLAESQGGALSLESSPLGGVRAVVELPAWQRETPEG